MSGARSSALTRAMVAYAAANGHLQIVKWLHAQVPPCPWNVYAVWNAARNNHLEVVQWLRTQEPPDETWDDEA